MGLLQYFFDGPIHIWSLVQVVSPNMFNMQLWETSGHAANYKENMFTFEVLLFLQLWLVCLQYSPYLNDTFVVL